MKFNSSYLYGILGKSWTIFCENALPICYNTNDSLSQYTTEIGVNRRTIPRSIYWVVDLGSTVCHLPGLRYGRALKLSISQFPPLSDFPGCHRRSSFARSGHPWIWCSWRLLSTTDVNAGSCPYSKLICWHVLTRCARILLFPVIAQLEKQSWLREAFITKNQ